MQNTPVREVMTKSLITVCLDETLTEVARIFSEYSFHHIPVVDKGNSLIGIISLTDFERIKNGVTLFRNPKIEEYNEALFQTLLVKDVMTKDVVHLRPMDAIQSAYKLLKKTGLRALPVIEKGKLIGIVTAIDILDFFFNQIKTNGRFSGTQN